MVAYWISLAAQVFLIVFVLGRRRASEYRWFLAFLSATIATEVAALFIPMRTLAYTYTWIACEPVLWMLRIAMVLEAWRALVREYPGSNRIAARVFFTAMVSAAVFSLALMPIEIPHVRQGQWIATTYTLMIVIRRVISLALALFVAAVSAIHLRYPVPIPRNLRAHGVMLTLYLAWDASQCFLVSNHGTLWVDEYALPIGFLIFVGWAFVYRRNGDISVDPPLTAEERLLIAEEPEFRAHLVQLSSELWRRVWR